jgi:hypothetical protein
MCCGLNKYFYNEFVVVFDGVASQLKSFKHNVMPFVGDVCGSFQ